MCKANNAALGNISNSRTSEQIARMQSTVGKGICPLCNGNGFRKNNRVIWRGKYWRAWFNRFAYPNHATHIVIATIKHVTSILDLPPEAGMEWLVLNQLLIKKYNLPGGALVWRFGLDELSGCTLFHCHTHIQVPDKKGFAIAVFFKDLALLAFLAKANKQAKTRKRR